ncbi:hypothetical protein [Polaribacter porphyrae]|uniref:Anti-sigma factor n=1 Tax=Polaribacter porphyrae TaxID=1137780 RepID=A0A2S7WR88_9FLAO|nr:hypothetical protein [Polaribacter porphyrae]PQJ79832.1 hypothetical protein BTO18_11885 [Polaribacter porphyrae]
MEHDIRDLFRENNDANIEIPKNHRAEFLDKLKYQHKKQNGFQRKSMFKIAASIAIILVCSVYYFYVNNQVEKTPLQIQVAAIEKEYLINIDKEWEQFIEVAEDSVLVNKYKIKMHDFDKDYQKITKELQKSPNNIYMLEALINNLQRRLELIKNIKEHIKELNQKNTSNETIYL